MRLLVSLAFLCALGATAPAQANPGAVRQACAGDVATLCQGVQPGGGRIKACLRTNKDKLSEGCKAAIAARIEARRAARAAQQSQSQAPATTPPAQ